MKTSRTAGSVMGPSLSIESQTCPVCKSDRYLNPNMKLLVSPCYHRMCESCINRLFSSGPAPCPQCRTTLRKAQFVIQTFEDLQVEKEVQIRKKVGKIFNKRLEDFKGDLRAYNDYLEEVEELMFNLNNDIDVERTKERIEQFKQENKDIIAANIQKQISEEKAFQYRLEREKSDRSHRRQVYKQLMEEEKAMRDAEKQKLLHDLESATTGEANKIMEDTLRRVHDIQNNMHLPNAGEDYDDAMFLAKGLDLDEVDEEFYATFDPFDDMYADIEFKLSEDYFDPLTSKIKNDKTAKAGGYLAKMTYGRGKWSSRFGVFI